MATDIQTIRALIGDRVKPAVNEVVGEGDGTNKIFMLDMYPLASSPTAVLTILLTGVTAAKADYSVSGEVGRITFGAAPTNGHTILATYDYYALTSGELTDILSGHTGEPYLAAANAAMILAADASRLFAYTMGDKRVDKRHVAKSLLDLSRELEKKHYTMKSSTNYAGTVFTMDDSGTVYSDYDTAVATLLTATS